MSFNKLSKRAFGHPRAAKIGTTLRFHAEMNGKLFSQPTSPTPSASSMAKFAHRIIGGALMKTYLALAMSLGIMTSQTTALASSTCLKNSDEALANTLKRTPLCLAMSSAESVSLFFSSLTDIQKDCPVNATVETINDSYLVLSTPEIKTAGFNDCVGQILPADPGIPTCSIIWCTPTN